MKVFGIIGWKDVGKTFYVCEIIKKLKAMGFKVASIKHAHHNFEIDHKNTDSYMHREAGSSQIIISSSKRWAKITELKNKNEKNLKYLLGHLSKTDFVIVEGFKKENHPKIEVINSKNNNYLFKEIKNVKALITNIRIDTDLPQFFSNEIDLIVKFIIEEFNE